MNRIEQGQDSSLDTHRSSLSSPLGVCVLPEPTANMGRTATHPAYIHEILCHAGICYQAVDVKELPALLPGLRLLVTIGDGELDDDLKALLGDWLEAGGSWLAVAGVCGLAELFGVEHQQPSPKWRTGGVAVLGEGYLKPSIAHGTLEHLEIPLHFFNGVAVQPNGGRVLATALDMHQRPTERASLVEHRVGRGRTMLVCPDVTGSVVRIQQGVAVTRDGVSAPDGSASVADGVLKTDDGAVLDWIFDRQPIPGVDDLSAFLQPIADQWRELLIRCILYLASEAGITLPVLWLYPRNLPAIAHVSHDSDGNDTNDARALVESLRKAEIESTWCVLAPGYEPAVVDEIRAAGHELALHFDSYSEGTEWSENEFDNQWKQIVQSHGERPTTNKNHFLRWEGDTEFFDWLAKRGIQVDASKGASKTGEAGFNFGFCHPHFPVDPSGRPLNVLEIATLSQDLGPFAPYEVIIPILGAVLKAHGVLHLIFHPAHITKPGVEQNMLDLIESAKALGMEWWTARRLNLWERARLKVEWLDWGSTDEAVSVIMGAGEPLEGASIMWPASGGATILVDGHEMPSVEVERWGFIFQSATLDIAPQRQYKIEFIGNS